MLKHALSYARRGLAVFPLNGKLPLTPHGLKDASADPAIISWLWMRFPEANIGVRTGDGLFVLDVDGEEGKASLRTLPALPDTVETITGSGGLHYWFRGEVGNRVGMLPGLDARGAGGYVVAPPSIHPNGRQYIFGPNCGRRIADAPDWLVDLVRQPKAEVHANPSGMVPEGQRNDAIARVAGKLLRQFALEPDFSLSLVLAFNAQYCAPPLPEDEVKRTFVSVARKENARRAGIKAAPSLSVP